MPYDYLWNEEDVSMGRRITIINILKQMKKAYSREVEYIQHNIVARNKLG
jgi:hypothetical protein